MKFFSSLPRKDILVDRGVNDKYSAWRLRFQKAGFELLICLCNATRYKNTWWRVVAVPPTVSYNNAGHAGGSRSVTDKTGFPTIR